MTTLETSAAAYHSISNKTKKSQGDNVLLLVTLANRAGVEGMTGQEVMRAYQERFGLLLYPNVISRVFNDLIKAKRLVRVAEKRLCTVSKHDAHPVMVPKTQGRFFE